MHHSTIKFALFVGRFEIRNSVEDFLARLQDFIVLELKLPYHAQQQKLPFIT